MMPPDPSNIVEVKMTSFDDLIIAPPTSKPKRSKPPSYYLTRETHFEYVQSTAEGKVKRETTPEEAEN